MTTFAELVVKVSNNYKQATEDAARFEQQSVKTERAATSFSNSSIILSQRVKSAILAEDAAKLESHRKQIGMFTQQLAQLTEMKRVEERVTQEHQTQLNARLANEKKANDEILRIKQESIAKQISLFNYANTRLLATVRETNARILAEEKANQDRINKLKSQAYLGSTQKIESRPNTGGVTTGLSQQNVVTAIQGPTITPAQLAANQAHSAQIAQRTALYSNMTAALGRVNVQSQSSINMINGMSAAYRAEQERLASINATYIDHINRLTMTAREYHNLQLQQQGMTSAQANHITSLTHYSNSHNMLQRVLTKSLAIMTAMAAYRTLSFIVTIPGEWLTINKDMELLKVRLEALTGSVVNAKVAFKDLVSLDFKTPFDIKGITETFLTLKNFGLNPTERIMTALTDTVSKMGGETQQLTGFTMQLGQAWSRGKLQMQDMRVMIENGIPVISYLKQTLNKTGAEILEMSKNGELTTEVISQMIDKMGELNKGGSDRMMNSLAGAISNVHTSYTQLIDALLEDKSESAIRKIFEVWSGVLRDWTSSITNVIDLNNELMKNWSDLAEIRQQISIAEKFPLLTTMDAQLGGNSLADLKEREHTLLSVQDKILANMGKEAKAKSENNQETETELAYNKALLAQEEQKQKAIDQQLALQEKYNVKENDTKNVVIDSKIADIKRLTEEKINQYELEKENIIKLRDAEKISANEKFLRLQDISAKIHTLNVQFKEKEHQLQLEKQAQVKSDFDAWHVAYQKVESFGGKSGTIGKTLAKGNQYAVGKDQFLPTTMMDPGYGIGAFKPAKDENILSFKNDRVKLLEWLKKYEPQLDEWTRKVLKTTYTLFNGDDTKNFLRWGDPKKLKMYIDTLGNMNGETIKQIQLNEKSKDLAKEIGDLDVSYTKEQTALGKELDNAKEKNNKLTESEIKKVQELRDAEIDRYNKATMSESKYYIEKLKHTEKSPGVLLNEQDIATISPAHDKADIVETQAKSYEKARQALIKYNDNIGLAKESLSAMAQIGNTVFDGQLGGINTVTGALDKMVTALQDNVKAFEQLAKVKKENDEFKPDPNKDTYKDDLKLQSELKVKYEKEYSSLETKNTMIAIDGVRQLTSATSNMFEQNSNAAKTFNIIALSGLAAKAAAAMLTQGEGDPYTAFARIAAMGAIVSSILATAGAGGFNFSASTPSMSKENEAKLKGAGTVLGDAEAQSNSVSNIADLLKSIHAEEYVELRGINKGIQTLQTGITDTVTRVFQKGGLSSITPSGKDGVTGIGSAAQGISKINIDPLGNLITKKLLGGIFGVTKYANIGTGIGTTPTPIKDVLSGKDMEAFQFDVIQKSKKSWFKQSFSYKVEISQLDKNITESLNSVFSSIGTIMLGLSQELGNGLEEKLRASIIPALNIDLKGLNGEDAAKKVNSIVSATLDTMAKDIFGDIIGQYQQLGEGMLETAVRIVSEVAVVKDALATSGLSLSENAIGISDAMVQAAGGLEEFQKQFETFYDKFFTDSEKQIRLTERLSNQLSDVFPPETIQFLGVARANYRKVLDAININTVAGQEQYSTLLQLAEGADAYYSTLESNQKTLMDGYQQNVTDAQKKLEDAYKSQSSSLTSTISKLNTFTTSLKALKDSLKIGDLSTNTPAQKYLETSKQYEATKATIAAGPGTTTESQSAFDNATSGLSSAAQNFLKASQIYSPSQYAKDYNKVLLDIENGIVISESMKTDSQKQLDILNQSLDGLININDSVLSVRDALLALYDANNKAGVSNIPVDIAIGISDATTALNRTLTSFETQWIKDQFNSGRDKSSIYNDASVYIKNQLDGSHANGLDFVPFDGYKAELHKGERVLTAKQVNTDGVISQEILLELKALREEVTKLRNEQNEQTGALIDSNYDANLKGASIVVTGTKQASKDLTWAAKSLPIIK